MPDRALTPVHRRIWRLGFLLTGNGPGATGLIDQIQRVRRDPSTLEPAILDRLIIQNARAIRRAQSVNLPSTGTTPFGVVGPATEALSAALRLPRQSLEAWVLRRLDDLDDLHLARAMDCSKTAAKVHLNAADETMAARLGANFAPALDALRKYADALDPEPFILAHRADNRTNRRHKLRRTALIAGAITLILTFILLKLLVSGSI